MINMFWNWKRSLIEGKFWMKLFLNVLYLWEARCLNLENEDAVDKASKPLQLPLFQRKALSILLFRAGHGVLLKNKIDAAAATERFITYVVRLLWCFNIFDHTNVRSYASDDFRAWSNMISPPPYSPYQNGNSERVWRRIFSMARCLLE